MAKNNINNNNQASKFSDLLGGLKAETKPSLSVLLDKSDTKSSPDQNINVANDDEQQNDSGKIKSPGDEQNNNNDVVGRNSGVVPGDSDNRVLPEPGAGEEPETVKKETGKGAVGEGQNSKKENIVSAEPKPKANSKKAKDTDFDRFLEKSRSAKTKTIFISEEYDTLMGRIVSQIGEGLTKTAYLDNILAAHFETFGEEIRKRRKAALEKQNNDL